MKKSKKISLLKLSLITIFFLGCGQSLDMSYLGKMEKVNNIDINPKKDYLGNIDLIDLFDQSNGIINRYAPGAKYYDLILIGKCPNFEQYIEVTFFYTKVLYLFDPLIKFWPSSSNNIIVDIKIEEGKADYLPQYYDLHNFHFMTEIKYLPDKNLIKIISKNACQFFITQKIICYDMSLSQNYDENWEIGCHTDPKDQFRWNDYVYDSKTSGLLIQK